MATRPTAPSRRAPVLLEREAELERAAAAISRACSGTGEVIVLEGPAGIGKTELVRAIRGLAVEAGMEALSARGDDLEREYAYGVVRQLFEAPLSRTEPAVRAMLFEGAAELAAGILGPATATPSPAEGSFAALHGLYWLTSNLAERAPLLLAVDDAHWADVPSLRFLHYLARRVAELPVVVLLARRPVESGTDGELVARIAGDPGAEVLLLAPLSEQATAELVRALLSPAAEVEFCRACNAATGGNPFLLRELIGALRHEGIAATGANVHRVARIAPDTISRHVLLRLMRLPPVATALARALAVLGSSVELPLAAGLANIEEASRPARGRPPDRSEHRRGRAADRVRASRGSRGHLLRDPARRASARARARRRACSSTPTRGPTRRPPTCSRASRAGGRGSWTCSGRRQQKLSRAVSPPPPARTSSEPWQSFRTSSRRRSSSANSAERRS